jgi:hypothetical protein
MTEITVRHCDSQVPDPDMADALALTFAYPVAASDTTRRTKSGQNSILPWYGTRSPVLLALASKFSPCANSLSHAGYQRRTSYC